VSAVRTSTASESAQTGPNGPIRTCIGCRQRAAAAELLRVVVAPDAIGNAEPALAVHDGSTPLALPVVPDPRHRIPGRGAWLHRDPECVELAQRRRSFARALRVPGPLDPTPVREYVATHAGTHHQRNPAGDEEL
jgi:predicted RNA-binding protein YlxR (DUF448 family)